MVPARQHLHKVSKEPLVSSFVSLGLAVLEAEESAAKVITSVWPSLFLAGGGTQNTGV